MSTSENLLRIFFRELFRDAVLIANPGQRTSLFLEDIIYLDDVQRLALTDAMVDWITIEGEQLVANTPVGTVSLPFDHVVMTYDERITGNVGVMLTVRLPSISTIPRQSLMEEQPFSIDVAPYLDYGSPVATLTATFPTWMTRNGTVFSGTPPDQGMARTEQIDLTLTNTVGTATGTVYLDIANNLVPLPVTIRTIPLQTGTELEMWSFDVSPYLVEGRPAGMFEWVSVPDWASTNGRVVSGQIPDRPMDTEWAFTFRWYNTEADETGNVQLRVGNTHFAPIWQDIPDQAAVLTQGYSLNLNNFVSGGPDTPVVTLLDTLDGYTFANGILSGFGNMQIPQRTVRARATNSQGTTDTTFLFQATPEQLAPSIAAIPQQMLNEGDAFSLDVEPYLTRGFPTATLTATFPSWVSQSGSVFSGTVPNRAMDVQEQIMLTLTNVVGIAQGNVELVIGNTQFPPSWQTIPVQRVTQGTSHSVNLRNFVTGVPAPVITAPDGLPTGFTLVNDVLATDGSLFGIHNINLLATNAHGTDTTTAEFRIEPDQAGDFPTRVPGINGLAFINDEFFVMRGDARFDVYSGGGLFERSFPVPEAAAVTPPFVTGAAAMTPFVYALNSGHGLFGYNPTTGAYANHQISPLNTFSHQRTAFFYDGYVWVTRWSGEVRRYRHGENSVEQFFVPGFDPDDNQTRIAASAEGYGYFWFIRFSRELVVTDDAGRVYDELGMTLSKIPSDRDPGGATIAYQKLYVGAFRDVYSFPITLRAPAWGTDDVPNLFPGRDHDIDMRDYASHSGIPKGEISVIPGMSLPDGFLLEIDTLQIREDDDGNYPPAGTYSIPLRISNSQGHDDRTFTITLAYPIVYAGPTAGRGLAYLGNDFWVLDTNGNLTQVRETDGSGSTRQVMPLESGYSGLTDDNNALFGLDTTSPRTIREINQNTAMLNTSGDVDLSALPGIFGAVVFADGHFRFVGFSNNQFYAYAPNGNRNPGIEFVVHDYPQVSGRFGKAMAYVDVGPGFFFWINDDGEAHVYDTTGRERTSLNRTFPVFTPSSQLQGAVYALNAIYTYNSPSGEIRRREIFEVPVWDDIPTIGVIADVPYTINMFDYLNTELVGLATQTPFDTRLDTTTGDFTITLSSGSENETFIASNPIGRDTVNVTFEVRDPLTEFPLHPDNGNPQALSFWNNHHLVLDATDNKIYAYDQLGRRNESLEVDLDATLFAGLGSGLTVIGDLAYITKAQTNSDIYVWNLSTKARDTSEEIDVQGTLSGIEGFDVSGANRFITSRVASGIQYVTTYNDAGSQLVNVANPILLATALIRGIAINVEGNDVYGSGSDGTIYVYDASVVRQSGFDFMAADIRGLYFRSNRLWGVDATHIRSWSNPALPIPDSFSLIFDPGGLVAVPSNGIYIAHNDAEQIENFDQHGIAQTGGIIPYHAITDELVAITYGNNRMYCADHIDNRIYSYGLDGTYYSGEVITRSIEAEEQIFFFYNDRLYPDHREVPQTGGRNVYLTAIMLNGTEDSSREINLGFFRTFHWSGNHEGIGDENIRAVTYFNGRLYAAVRVGTNNAVPATSELQLRTYTVDASYVATEVTAERRVLLDSRESCPNINQMGFTEMPRKVYCWMHARGGGVNERVIQIFDY